MKTLKNFLISFACVVGALALIQSCEPNPLWVLPGSTVKFTATSGLGKAVKTKTIYSGATCEIEEGLWVERIDWVVGDNIRIWSDNAYDSYDPSLNYADYVVTGVSHDEEHDQQISKAEIDNTGDPANGLVWGEGEHAFYSIYPSPTTNSGVSETTTLGTYTLNFPATHSYTQEEGSPTLKPNMDYAYMYAAVKTGAPTAMTKVNLAFQPMFTALQITVDSGYDDTMTLESFTLSSASKAVCGELTAVLTATASGGTAAYTFPDAADDNKSVTLSFGTDGVIINKGTPVTFTVFILPQDYDDLTITFETSAGQKMLDLKKTEDGVETGIPFFAGLKYNIDLGGMPGTILYVLDVDAAPDGITFTNQDISSGGATKNINIKSYRTLSSGVKQPVSWKAQSLAADGTTWVDITDEQWLAWLGLSEAEGEGSISNRGETIAVRVTPDHEDVTVEEVSLTSGVISQLVNASPVGSENSPRDLSLYDIYGNLYVNGTNAVSSITKAGSHTANCYVVNAPGYYCFPLVYGNAIDQTRGNSSGVYDSAYSKYTNCEDNRITSPYILTDLDINASVCDAVVVWEDQHVGKEVIRTIPEVIAAPSGAGLSCDYIKFYIDPRDILPGNIVIALRDQNQRILWSWHIWIAPSASSDMCSINDLVYRLRDDESPASLSTIQILNCPLGWSMPLKFKVTSNGNSKIRIVQNHPNGKTVAFPVSYQSGNTYAGTYAAGTYYQWGRKDPYLPSNGNTGNAATNRACYSPSGYQITATSGLTAKSLNTRSMAGEIGEWIQFPYLFNNSNSWIGYDHSDLWNSASGSQADCSGDLSSGTNRQKAVMTRLVKKTIYDPSPAGFCVPVGRAFTGFTTDGRTYYSQAGQGQTAHPENINGYVLLESDDAARPAGMYFTRTATHTSDWALNPANPDPNYSVFVPASGSRNYFTGQVGHAQTNAAGYFWTSVVGSSTYLSAVSMTISYMNNYRNRIFPIHDACYASDGLHILPMLETDGIAVTGENLSAWDE